MKTTNFENSKKLAEMGFVGESETWKHDPDNFITGQKYPSYDLETMLEQISFVIHNVEKSKIFWFQMNQQDFEYRSFEGETLIDFYIVRQKNESLADTAARLLITLAEQGIINFNK